MSTRSKDFLSETNYTKVQSPVGELTLICDRTQLLAILWEKEKRGRVKLPLGKMNSSHPILKEAKKQLGEYFQGKRNDFDLPLGFNGTEFQKLVWQTLLKIPYGQTATYSALAKKIGRPKSARAVGSANGRNPLSIVVPCHRVIGKNDDLVGFAGGLDVKRQLLGLESNRNLRKA